jgi:peptidoglycan/LPS O-acetylase OafA/YrhL
MPGSKQSAVQAPEPGPNVWLRCIPRLLRAPGPKWGGSVGKPTLNTQLPRICHDVWCRVSPGWKRGRSSVRTVGNSSRGPRSQLFDVMRIAAALGVIFSHSYALVGRHEPTLAVGGISFNIGALCVGVFFTISGFLIPSSWDRDPSVPHYIRKRFARIWPGLLVCLLVTALIVGPFVTTRGLGTYFHSSMTRLYVIGGATLFAWKDKMPGVFTSNAFPVAVDGPLWTLPYEVLAYIGVLVIGLLHGFNQKWVVVSVAVGTFIALQVVVATPMIGHDISFFNIDLHELLILAAWFGAGSMLYALHWEPTRRSVLAAVAVVAVALVLGLPIPFMCAAAVLIVAMGSISFKRLERITRLGDPSYGIYIYGWLVQQTFVRFGLSLGDPFVLFGEAATVSIVVGYLSWHLVERPAMRALRPPRPIPSVPTGNLRVVSSALGVEPPSLALGQSATYEGSQ